MTNPMDNREMEQRLLGYGLEQLALFQYMVSSKVPGSLSSGNGPIIETSFALIGEIVETIQELGWKSWKDNPEMNPEQVARVAEEFADVLAFLGMLMLLITQRTGLQPEDFAAAYVEKSRKNLARFAGTSGEAGYSGV